MSALALLEEIATALHGAQWQSPIARDLGVTDRTVRRWVAGTTATPADIGEQLLRVIERRACQLEQLRATLSGERSGIKSGTNR